MKIEFPIPEGFNAPDGVPEGESFEFMAGGYISGGNLVLTSVEGLAVGEEKKAEPTEDGMTAPDDRDFVDSVETGLA